MTRRAWLTIAVAVASCAIGPHLLAHPASSTEVVIALEDAALVSVELTADAASLITKLEARGATAESTATRDLAERVRELSQTLLDGIELTVDGGRIPLSLSRVIATTTPPSRVTIALSGRVPSSAVRVTWKTSLVFGAYPLVVRRGSSAPSLSGTRTASDASQIVQWLNGAEVSQPVDLADVPAPFGVRSLTALVWLGFSHIVPHGLDHILFVLGLFLLSRRRRDLLWQITAFTVAHSVTLGLAIFGVVALPNAMVEPLIALSIVYVGVENLRARAVTRSRVAIVFAFGLLHGLGFAAALTSLGGSRRDLLSALFGFNVGVEAGQLAVVAGAGLVVALLRVPPAQYQRLIARPASLAIAVAGCLWVAERVWQG